MEAVEICRHNWQLTHAMECLGKIQYKYNKTIKAIVAHSKLSNKLCKEHDKKKKKKKLTSFRTIIVGLDSLVPLLTPSWHLIDNWPVPLSFHESLSAGSVDWIDNWHEIKALYNMISRVIQIKRHTHTIMKLRKNQT